MNALLKWLLLLTGGLVLLLVGFLAASVLWPGSGATLAAKAPPTPEGGTAGREAIQNPPEPPRPVANPKRFRQNLQPGKTYVTQTKGHLHAKGEDNAWGFRTSLTIAYGFEAKIDREIESNDGTTVVELRHFREVKALKILSTVDGVKLDLGPIGEAFISPVIQSGLKQLELKPVVDYLTTNNLIEGLDKKANSDLAKTFASVSSLNGKKVRLTYQDGKGVQKIEAVKGEITAEERDFHLNSVLVSDSLIIPDVDIEVGNRWEVDGSNFAGFLDPSLLSRIGGELVVERVEERDPRYRGKTRLEVVDGQLLFDDSNSTLGRNGYFKPRGRFHFSPEDQIIVEATLKGAGEIKQFSKDHLLFESRLQGRPDIEVQYQCRVTETLKGKP